MAISISSLAFEKVATIFFPPKRCDSKVSQRPLWGCRRAGWESPVVDFFGMNGTPLAPPQKKMREPTKITGFSLCPFFSDGFVVGTAGTRFLRDKASWNDSKRTSNILGPEGVKGKLSGQNFHP